MPASGVHLIYRPAQQALTVATVQSAAEQQPPQHFDPFGIAGNGAAEAPAPADPFFRQKDNGAQTGADRFDAFGEEQASKQLQTFAEEGEEDPSTPLAAITPTKVSVPGHFGKISP